MKLERYPLKMRPAYKDSLWGGDALKRKFGKDSGLAVTAESWELSTQSAGLSIIANGAYADMTFAQYAGQYGYSGGIDGSAYLGWGNGSWSGSGTFPGGGFPGF